MTIGDNLGNIQVIRTNKTHPFFVQSDNITPATEGYIYQGNIANANWTDANSLKVGDKLPSENNTRQTVQSVKVSQEPITAYNLTVNNNHTFFVKAENGKYGVLVHNKRKKSKNTNNTNKQENPALSNLSKPLSKTTIDHLMGRHNYHRVKIQFNTLVNKQGKTKEQAYQILNLGNRTFFNKSWNEQKKSYLP